MVCVGIDVSKGKSTVCFTKSKCSAAVRRKGASNKVSNRGTARY
ncbi:MAG: hypothetical protein K0S22_971 [Oscillospiraceae bacterium]|jgi:hypothetical protein|nr:hypothetical protein [Oscillospiraceae bacterium]